MTNRPVVFFVDDQEGILRFATILLERAGYHVLTAASAEEAGRVIDAYEDAIDVLLMDINLPDAWGANLAQTLRLAHPEMRVVYTTGFAGTDEVLSGGLNDAELVLPKPFSGDALIEIIERARRRGSGPEVGED